MKLLIVTQKVDINDPILGFFHRWLEEFSKNVEKVTVICLYEGEHHLPKNVRVYSLGKEGGRSRFKYTLRFFKYIWKFKDEYDAVFVHMNQIYVILGGIYWKIIGKPVSLWYAHKQVSRSLKLATTIVDRIFSPSKESFRYKTSKLRIMSQGIDLDLFSPNPARAYGKKVKLVTSGRISPIKNVHKMLEVLSGLTGDYIFTVIGGTSSEVEEQYKRGLLDFIHEHGMSDRVVFVGPKAQAVVAQILRDSDIFLNMSDTGSLDKAILEAMSCEVIPVASNVAFRDILRPWELFVEDNSNYAEKLTRIMDGRGGFPVEDLRTYVRQEHGLSSLIKNLVNSIASLIGK